MTAVKILLLMMIAVGVPIMTAAVAMRGAGIRRALLAFTVFSFVWQPLMTLSYLYLSKYNARGIEFGWAELLLLGLVVARLREPMPLPRLFSPVFALWVAHVAILVLASFAGLHLETSLWYCWRMVRGLAVMLMMAMVVRDRRDVEAVLGGLILTCLYNECWVLYYKYKYHVWQNRGAFDHQNAMGMYMILCAAPMFAAWMFRAVRAELRWPLFIGILCAGHGVFSGLSRGSMAFFGLTMAATALSSCVLSPDRHKLRALTLICVTGFAGFLVVAPHVIERFHDRGNLISERTREVMILVAQQMHEDHQWLGVGPNNYAYAVNLDRYVATADILDRERGYHTKRDALRGQVESLYWGIRAETGTLGLVSLLAFMVVSVLVLAGKAVSAPDGIGRAVVLGSCFALIANYLQCTLEHTLLHPQNLYLWLSLVAVSTAVPWRREVPQPVGLISEDPLATVAPRPTPPPTIVPPRATAPVFWT